MILKFPENQLSGYIDEKYTYNWLIIMSKEA